MPIASKAGGAPLELGRVERSDRLPAAPQRRAPTHGPPRVSGQAAFRQARRRRAGRRGRRDGRRRGRRGGADRLSLRDQGPGADRRPRQGRRDQDRQGRRGGARLRRRDPRHGHRRAARRGAVPGRPGLDRGRLRHRLGVLRLGDPRPRREEAAGDGLGQGWDGHRGRRRGGPRGAGQGPHRPDQALRRRRGAADRRRRRPRRGRARAGRRGAGRSWPRWRAPRTRT